VISTVISVISDRVYEISEVADPRVYPTFGLFQWVNLIKEWLPKAGIKLLKISYQNTVYVKSFEVKNFRGFHKFLLTTNVLPLKIFLEYQLCPLTTKVFSTY